MKNTTINDIYSNKKEIDESIILKAKLFNVNLLTPFQKVLKLYNISIEELINKFNVPEKQMSKIVNKTFPSVFNANIYLLNKLSHFFNFTIDFFIKERIQTNILLETNESLTYFNDNLPPCVKIEYDFNSSPEDFLYNYKNIYKNVYYIDFDLYIVLRSLRLVIDKFDSENEQIRHYFKKKSLINDLTLNNPKLFKIIKSAPKINNKINNKVNIKDFKEINFTKFKNRFVFNFIYINKVFHPFDLRFFLSKTIPNDELYLDILKYSLYSYLSKDDVDYILKNYLYSDYFNKDKSLYIFTSDSDTKYNFSFNQFEHIINLLVKYKDALNDIEYSNREFLEGNYLNKEMNAPDLYLFLYKKTKTQESEM